VEPAGTFQATATPGQEPSGGCNWPDQSLQALPRIAAVLGSHRLGGWTLPPKSFNEIRGSEGDLASGESEDHDGRRDHLPTFSQQREKATGGGSLTDPNSEVQ
jgi:hypothetical protein